MFADGNWQLFLPEEERAPRTAMIPGYHALAAGFTRLVGSGKPDVVRGLNFGFAMLLARSARGAEILRPPLVFLLIFREKQTPAIEMLTWGLYCVLGLALHWVHVTGYGSFL